MAKTLGFTYKGVDYTLEFTRKTVSRMEQDGFSIGDIREANDTSSRVIRRSLQG